QQDTGHVVLGEVVDRSLLHRHHPVLQGLQGGIQGADGAVGDVEDVGAEVRGVVVDLPASGHASPGGRSHVGVVVHVLHTLPAQARIRILCHVAGGEHVIGAGAQQRVHHDAVVDLEPGVGCQIDGGLDSQTADHRIHVQPAAVGEVEVDTFIRGPSTLHGGAWDELHTVAGVGGLEVSGELL